MTVKSENNVNYRNKRIEDDHNLQFSSIGNFYKVRCFQHTEFFHLQQIGKSVLTCFRYETWSGPVQLYVFI